MSKVQELKNLEQLLDTIKKTTEQNDKEVTLDNILDVVGRRSFGPLLLVAGIITLTPVVGDIPGVPTAMGIIVLVTGIQLIFRVEHFWLPKWLLKRSIKTDKLKKALKWVRRPAKFIDRFLKQRLMFFTKGPAVYVIAVICILIAVATPAMELVPFSANGAGAALTAFGLSLIAHDGLLSLIAFLFTAITVGIVVYNLI